VIAHGETALRHLARPMLPRPPHPVPNVRDDRDTPLCAGRDGVGYRIDLGESRTEMFFQTGLDSPNHIDPVRQIRPCAQTVA
jgi:hypothetical protein